MPLPHVSLVAPTQEVLTKRRRDYLESSIGLFLLADRLQDPGSASCIIDNIFDFFESYGHRPSGKDIRTVNENSLSNSPLRRMMSDICV